MLMNEVDQASSSNANNSLILHVIVVGFHHKKGYQVEYCYPPININNLTNGEKITEKNYRDSNECQADWDLPIQWESLPTLALPDGAHNVDSDIIYFTLPSLENQNRAIFGVSSYRQVSVDEDYKQTDSHVTRSSIQKAVCVLSTIPLYGVLNAKLEVITHAYFNEKDFTKIDVLHQMYNNLCELVNSDYLDPQTIYSGISIFPLLRAFRQKILVLFKLLLLEKRVIFHMFPVNLLGEMIIGLISLFPVMLEEGLFESAFYSILRHPQSFSQIPLSVVVKESRQFEKEPPEPLESPKYSLFEEIEFAFAKMKEKESISPSKGEQNLSDENHLASPIHTNDPTWSSDENAKINEQTDELSPTLNNKSGTVKNCPDISLQSHQNAVVDCSTNSERRRNDDDGMTPSTSKLPSTSSSMKRTDTMNEKTNPSSFRCDDYGFPLSIFTKGSIFHPYLSVTALDMLCSDNIRSFCIGVTNQLFAQRHKLLGTDVLVSVNEKGESNIEILNSELKRQLALTKTDTKFINSLLQIVDQRSDATGWEGSDDWIRTQFSVYLLSLLTSMAPPGHSNQADFNAEFVAAYRVSHNFRVWSSGRHPLFEADYERDAYKSHPASLLTTTRRHSPQQRVKHVLASSGASVKSRLSNWMKGMVHPNNAALGVAKRNFPRHNSASSLGTQPVATKTLAASASSLRISDSPQHLSPAAAVATAKNCKNPS